jgi:cysteine synthase
LKAVATKENPVSVLELIGRAPLIMLRRADESGTIELHAKAEFQNPGSW